MPHIKYMTELRRLLVFSVPTFSSYNPDIAKKAASAEGVTPLRWRARGPNQGGKSRGKSMQKSPHGRGGHQDWWGGCPLNRYLTMCEK